MGALLKASLGELYHAEPRLTPHDRAVLKLVIARQAIEALPGDNSRILEYIEDAASALDDWTMPSEADLARWAAENADNWSFEDRKVGHD